MTNLQENNGEAKKRIDYNSTTNQDIKGKFVNREIIENVNIVVEDLIKANQLDHNLGFDIYEYLQWYFTASDGEQYTQEEADEKIQELDDEIQELNSTIIYLEDEGHSATEEEKELQELEELKEELETADFEEITEIYEYWSVSGWLGKKLEEKGQIIIDECGLCIWGRQTTGQAILLDYVISQICEDLEILEGQASDWSKQK